MSSFWPLTGHNNYWDKELSLLIKKNPKSGMFLKHLPLEEILYLNFLFIGLSLR